MDKQTQRDSLLDIMPAKQRAGAERGPARGGSPGRPAAETYIGSETVIEGNSLQTQRLLRIVKNSDHSHILALLPCLDQLLLCFSLGSFFDRNQSIWRRLGPTRRRNELELRKLSGQSLGFVRIRVNHQNQKITFFL